jgi:hypothetical protein
MSLIARALLDTFQVTIILKLYGKESIKASLKLLLFCEDLFLIQQFLDLNNNKKKLNIDD